MKLIPTRIRLFFESIGLLTQQTETDLPVDPEYERLMALKQEKLKKEKRRYKKLKKRNQIREANIKYIIFHDQNMIFLILQNCNQQTLLMVKTVSKTWNSVVNEIIETLIKPMTQLLSISPLQCYQKKLYISLENLPVNTVQPNPWDELWFYLFQLDKFPNKRNPKITKHMVEFLCEKKVDVKRHNYVIKWACENELIDIIKILIRCGADHIYVTRWILHEYQPYYKSHYLRLLEFLIDNGLTEEELVKVINLKTYKDIIYLYYEKYQNITNTVIWAIHHNDEEFFDDILNKYKNLSKEELDEILDFAVTKDHRKYVIYLMNQCDNIDINKIARYATRHNDLVLAELTLKRTNRASPGIIFYWLEYKKTDDFVNNFFTMELLRLTLPELGSKSRSEYWSGFKVEFRSELSCYEKFMENYEITNRIEELIILTIKKGFDPQKGLLCGIQRNNAHIIEVAIEHIKDFSKPLIIPIMSIVDMKPEIKKLLYMNNINFCSDFDVALKQLKSKK